MFRGVTEEKSEARADILERRKEPMKNGQKKKSQRVARKEFFRQKKRERKQDG
jgi:hypothetical protein